MQYSLSLLRTINLEVALINHTGIEVIETSPSLPINTDRLDLLSSVRFCSSAISAVSFA